MIRIDIRGIRFSTNQYKLKSRVVERKPTGKCGFMKIADLILKILKEHHFRRFVRFDGRKPRIAFCKLLYLTVHDVISI
jgi:hypothetical protein